MHGELANIWKKDIIEDLEAENLIYTTVEEFPADLKEEFRERDDKILKVAELKKVK